MASYSFINSFLKQSNEKDITCRHLHYWVLSAGPCLTLQSIKSSIETRDMESLSDNVDGPVPRQNLKNKLNAQVSSAGANEFDDWGVIQQ